VVMVGVCHRQSCWAVFGGDRTGGGSSLSLVVAAGFCCKSLLAKQWPVEHPVALLPTDSV
jgi:hypothetical protein